MQEQEIELAVGDTVQIGDYAVTVVDIDAEDISVRVDHVEEAGEIRFVDGMIVIDK